MTELTNYEDVLKMKRQSPKQINVEDIKINRKPKNARKHYLHSYIIVHLSQHNISQAAIAKFCGCSAPHVNQVIFGTDTNSKVQELICKILGCSDWVELEREALAFSKLFSKSKVRA